MANTSTHRFTVDASPEAVVAAITSAAFEIAQQTAQDGTKSASVEEVSRDERKLVYIIHTEEYAKGVTGIDRSKTEKATTRVEWDLGARKGSWTYSGSHGARVKVWGNTAVRASGNGSTVECDFNVDVKIPLIGGKVEKIVLRETDKFWPTFERLAREHAASAA